GIPSLASSAILAGNGLRVGATYRGFEPTPATRGVRTPASVSMTQVCRRTPKNGSPTLVSALSSQASLYKFRHVGFFRPEVSNLQLPLRRLRTAVLPSYSCFGTFLERRCCAMRSAKPYSQPLCDSSPGKALSAKFDYTPRIYLPSWTPGVRE